MAAPASTTSTCCVKSPVRIDVGAYIDLPQLFCLFPSGTHATFNAAIAKHICITAVFRKEAQTITLHSGASSSSIDSNQPQAPLHGYPLSLLRFLNLPMGDYYLTTDVVPEAGLGGSSALTVAFLMLSEKLRQNTVRPRDRRSLALSANIIESSFGRTTAGLQDYLATCFGGANLWSWGNHGEAPLASRRKLGLRGQRLLETCGFLMKPLHSRGSNAISPGALETMIAKNLGRWTAISQATVRFFEALQDGNLSAAVRHMVAETETVSEVFPSMTGNITRLVMDLAKKHGGAGRFCGFGHDGYCWALIPQHQQGAFLGGVNSMLAPGACERIAIDHGGVR